MYDFKFTASI